MKSMTGYGAAEARWENQKLRVEVSSVNSRKGIDLVLNLPRELSALEPVLREKVQGCVSRGRVALSLDFKNRKTAGGKLYINRTLLKQHAMELKSLARATGCNTELSLEFLLRLPGVQTDETVPETTEKLAAQIVPVVEKALAAFQKSRAREGAFLCAALARSVGHLEKTVARILERKDGVLLRYRQNLQKKIAEAGLQVPLDDERLVKEIVIFSDRCDITEETTRLHSHLVETRRLLKSPEAIGRNLDFLLQEIGREVNTVGSKANDIDISRWVVELKTELEKIREQVQNLE